MLARSLRCDEGVPDPASAAARLLSALVFATTSLTLAVAAVASAVAGKRRSHGASGRASTRWLTVPQRRTHVM